MVILFDRGTVLLRKEPPGVRMDTLPGVCWDGRVQAYRAPAFRHRGIVESLGSQGVSLRDEATSWQWTGQGLWEAVKLRPYQAAAVWAWRAAGCHGVVALPTGSGKTWVALAAAASAGMPCLIVVPTRILLHQWRLALERVYRAEVGCWGDGQRRLEPVTVTTFESAYRHMAAWGHRFGMLVVDEAHHFGGSERDLLLEMAVANVRLGLTATPPGAGPRADRLAELLGPQVYGCSLAELSGRYLAEFDRITMVLELSPAERSAYEAEYGAFRAVYGPFRQATPAAPWADFLREARRSDAGRRAVAAWRASRQLLGYTQAKDQALRWLLGEHRAQRVLIFTANNETAYRIAREQLVMPITCDIGRRERGDALAAFREGRLRTLVSARVLNEGLDVPEAEVGIIVGGSQGAREYVQRLGRLLRPAPGKRAVLYELITRATPETRQARERELSLDTLVHPVP
ncbi:MAG: DEAD/DEAH box helicase family protein [bacterium]